MSVISAVAGRPAPCATPTIVRASSRAWSIEGMNAPEPHFTSMTKPWSPAASFFARIEAVISGMLSTVPLMSRVASGNEWIVNIDFAVLNEVDIYLTKQGQLIQHAALGNLPPNSERPLRGPLPQVKLMPTGGVDLTTAAEFLKAGAVCLGVGGQMVEPAAVAAGDFARIARMAAVQDDDARPDLRMRPVRKSKDLRQ